MVKTLRDIFLTLVISFVISCFVWELCFADEILDESVLQNEEEIILDESQSEYESNQSDIIPDSTSQSFANLYVENLYVQPVEPEDEEEEEEVLVYTNLAAAPQSSLPSIPRDNTVLYRGSFGGRDCWLLLPFGASDSLVTLNGVLVNVGSSSITGRLLYSDELDLSSYDDTFLVLVSQFSTNLPGQIYNYSYSSYSRYYFHNGTRITYIDTYGDFIVSEQVNTESSSNQEKITSVLILICLFVGSRYIFDFFRIARR